MYWPIRYLDCASSSSLRQMLAGQCTTAP